MNVKIGPYLSPIVITWHRDYMRRKHGYCWDIEGKYTPTKWENYFEKFEDGIQWILNHTINPILNKRKRKIKVKIHPYDTWGMYNTLAVIILPMLKQLKETKSGAPWVDDADVPEELKSTSAPKKENEWDTDDNFFKRWDYVLDEAIWAFEQLVDGDSDDKFFGPDFKQLDKEGYDAWQARKQRGFILFGKYMEALWD